MCFEKASPVVEEEIVSPLLEGNYMLFIIVMFFIALIIYCVGRHGFRGSSITWLNHPRINTPLFRLYNPFNLRLHNSESSSFQGVELALSGHANFLIQDFWCVRADKLEEYVCGDWHELFHTEHLANSSRCAGRMKFQPPCTEKIMKFSPSIDLDDFHFEAMPRNVYPLVIVLLKLDSKEVHIDGKCEVIATITVLHIRHQSFPVNSKVLFQAVKLSNNSIFQVRKLFKSSSVNNDEDSEALCVICQSNSATIALLNCRHLCLCKDCFVRVDRCPVCRSFISSHVMIPIDEENYE